MASPGCEECFVGTRFERAQRQRRPTGFPAARGDRGQPNLDCPLNSMGERSFSAHLVFKRNLLRGAQLKVHTGGYHET
jgi:hypothetical protein